MVWDVHISAAEEMVHTQNPLRSASSSFYCDAVSPFETHVVHQKLGLTDFTGSLVTEFEVKVA